jgi:predicted nucleic acid-binding protein
MTSCLDASLVLRLLLCEPGSEEVEQWLALHADDDFVAPHFFVAEVASVIRSRCRRSIITGAQAHQALCFLANLNVRLVWDWSLAERAFALAEELDQPTVYDSLYLALAEAEGCELWTADEQFARCAAPRYPFVRLVGSA